MPLVSPPTSSVSLITEPAQLVRLCAEIANEPFYAFDTEFHTEKTYRPNLALIQLGWADQIALIDPLALDPSPLGEIFAGPGIGVAHAADQDLEVLAASCGAAPSQVFDTQIVAGFLGQSTPSLVRLVDQVLGVSLSKTDQLSDWLLRPLPASQLDYAANDVRYLLELREALTSKLQANGRLEWALEECAATFATLREPVDPSRAWWKVSDVRRVTGRGRGIAQEVAAWRERRASALNRPRRSVLPDLAIVTIAQRSPKTRHDLESLRGVDPRYLAKGASSEILDAVERGRHLGGADLNLPPEPPGDKASAVTVGVCAAVARHIAITLSIDPSLLATRVDISQLVLGMPSRLDSGWRLEMAGTPLRRLLEGATSLAFSDEGDMVLEDRVATSPTPTL